MRGWSPTYHRERHNRTRSLTDYPLCPESCLPCRDYFATRFQPHHRGAQSAENNRYVGRGVRGFPSCGVVQCNPSIDFEKARRDSSKEIRWCRKDKSNSVTCWKLVRHFPVLKLPYES